MRRTRRPDPEGSPRDASAEAWAQTDAEIAALWPRVLAADPEAIDRLVAVLERRWAMLRREVARCGEMRKRGSSARSS